MPRANESARGIRVVQGDAGHLKKRRSRERARLLEGDGCAGLLEGSLRLVSGFLGRALEHGLGSAVDDGLGLAEAVVDGAPKAVLEGATKEAADKAKAALEEAGATVTLK